MKDKNAKANKEVSSDILKSLRKEKGLTIVEVSEKLNIPFSTLQQYDQGRRSPSYINLRKLSEFYGVDESYILGYTDYRKESDLFDSTDFYVNQSEKNLISAFRDTNQTTRDAIFVLLGLKKVEK